MNNTKREDEGGLSISFLTNNVMTTQAQKRSVGIDISKDTFTACISSKSSNDSLGFSEVGNFKNDKSGFNQLVKWVRKGGKSLNEVNF